MLYEAEIDGLAGMTEREVARRVGCSPSHVHKVRKRQQAPIVYYIRFADRVKIGMTTHLYMRITNIPCDELLAVEPGGAGLEQARHEQFGHLRIIGEWFQLTPELLAHAGALRTQHRLPDVPRQKRYNDR